MIDLINEMIQQQNQKLYLIAKEKIPTITQDDLLQPFDYPELENDPNFRYEEGVLMGMFSVKAAILANDSSFS